MTANTAPPSPPREDITVIVATFQRPELLRRCLLSLLAQTRPAAEIIVADQSHDQQSREVVDALAQQHPGLRYRHGVPPNKSLALNRSLAEARGAWLAFTDDDCQVAPDWLERFARLQARHQDVDVWYGCLLPEPGSAPENYINLILDRSVHPVRPLAQPFYTNFSGANCFIRRGLCERAGGFNPDFGPGGTFRNDNDGEMAYRLARVGARMLFHGELVVHHAAWRGRADNHVLTWNYAWSLGAFSSYTLRRGDMRPALHFTRLVGHKARRLLLGLVLFQPVRRRDGWLHLRAYVSGWRAGWRHPVAAL
ncbi:MAG: glycosyltransferase [Magnetococcus sp. WYHC-3]